MKSSTWSGGKRKGIPADDILHCEMRDHPVQGRVLVSSSRDSQPFGYTVEYYRRAQVLLSHYAPPNKGSWIPVGHEYAGKIMAVCAHDSE